MAVPPSTILLKGVASKTTQASVCKIPMSKISSEPNKRSLLLQCCDSDQSLVPGLDPSLERPISSGCIYLSAQALSNNLRANHCCSFCYISMPCNASKCASDHDPYGLVASREGCCHTQSPHCDMFIQTISKAITDGGLRLASKHSNRLLVNATIVSYTFLKVQTP